MTALLREIEEITSNPLMSKSEVFRQDGNVYKIYYDCDYSSEITDF